MFKRLTRGIVVVFLIVFGGVPATAADEPTLCELLEKERKAFNKMVETAIFWAENVNMRKLRKNFAYYMGGTPLPPDETNDWLDALHDLEKLVENDWKANVLIYAYRKAVDDLEYRDFVRRAAYEKGDLKAQEQAEKEFRNSLKAYDTALAALEENPRGFLWRWYLEWREPDLDYLLESLNALASSAAMHDAFPGASYFEQMMRSAHGEVDGARQAINRLSDKIFDELCKTPPPASKPKADPPKKDDPPERPLVMMRAGPGSGPHAYDAALQPTAAIGFGDARIYPRIFVGSTGPASVVGKFMPWLPFDPREVPKVGPTPDPLPADRNAQFGLNPRPEAPSIAISLAALTELPAAQRVETLSQARQWAENSDPRVVYRAQLGTESVAAVLADLGYQGLVTGDSSWGLKAQEGLKHALELMGGDTPPADAATKEIQTLNKLALLGALSRLDAIGLVPLNALITPPEPKPQAGIQFAKVTAKSDKAEPVPGATMVFKITKKTPDGPRETTEIAKANDQGEVNLLPPGDPGAKDQPGDSTIVVGPEDTIQTVVITGTADEQPVAFSTAQAGAAESDTPGTLVVRAQPQPEYKVALAISDVEPKNATAEGDNPDVQKMQAVQQASVQALLQIIGVKDAKLVPDPDPPRPPTYHLGLARSGQDEQGAWTPRTFARQSGVSLDPQPEQPGIRLDPQPEQPGRQKPFVAWTFPLPRPQTPDGKPIPVTLEQVQQAAALVAQQDNVILAEAARPRNAEALPDDPYFASRGSWGQRHMDQWALHRIGFTPAGTRKSAWPKDLAVTRYLYKPITVAVIGSGVDYTHPDLVTRMWVNRRERLNGRDDDGNGYVDDVFGWNFRDNNRDVMDYGGHDTHVAGLIAAEWNNGYGIAGINPMARIMALKVADLFGNSDSAAISQAIYYAVDHGSRVINVSYSGGELSTAEQLAIDYAVDKGVLVVAAAGNQATDNSAHGVAGAAGVLTVAATAVEGDRAAFSNWGQAVEIAAPGLDILSLRARDTDFLLYVGENANYQGGSAVVGKQRDLYRAGGTSFAAPLVAGTASLIWSLEPALTLDQIRRKLLISAEDIDTPGWDQTTGAGLLDAKQAIAADPDRYLVTRITKVAPGPPDGDTPRVDVHGIAVGADLKGAWLQIGFGENPAKDEWQTVHFSKEPLSGQIHLIPLTKFARSGVWTIRLLAQDNQDQVRQSRARLNLE